MLEYVRHHFLLGNYPFKHYNLRDGFKKSQDDGIIKANFDSFSRTAVVRQNIGGTLYVRFIALIFSISGVIDTIFLLNFWSD